MSSGDQAVRASSAIVSTSLLLTALFVAAPATAAGPDSADASAVMAPVSLAKALPLAETIPLANLAHLRHLGLADRDAKRSHLLLSGLSVIQLLALVQGASPNQCVTYAFDLNGNITTRTDAIYGATATWGSSAYGCFNWTSP